jgi:DNA-binding transcriptional LysR family regulator
MNDSLLQARQMRAFLAVAEELSYTKAAQRLHITQPPLTRQIKALEKQIGTQLFVRKATGVELTDAGRLLKNEMPSILELSHRVQERVRLAGSGLIGTLDIGVSGSPVLDLIPRLLIHLQKRMPGLTCRLHADGKLEQVSELQKRRISVGFTRLASESPSLVVESVFRERLFVATHETSAIKAKVRVTLRDLEDLPMILYPNIPVWNMAQNVTKAFRDEGVRINIAHLVDDVVTSVALVACGFGSCIVAESATRLTLPGVVYLPLQSEALQDIELNCIYRRDDDSPLLRAFLEVVRAFSWRR